MTIATGHNPWKTVSVEIREITDELEGTATYKLLPVVPAAADCRFVPGQFNMIYLPGVGEVAISMSGDPSRTDSWIHTIRVAGNVTGSLAALEPGDQLGLRGPFGTGWPLGHLRGCDVLLVSGGLGLAPLRPLIYHLQQHRADYGQIWLINGARSPAGLLYRQECADWQKCMDVQLTVDRATDDWTGQVGVVTLPVDRLTLPRPDRTRVVTCGPEVMMKFVAASAIRRGVSPEHIWISLERNMQCAAGQCGHCLFGPAFVCKDGPVFRYDRMHRYLNVESL